MNKKTFRGLALLGVCALLALPVLADSGTDNFHATNYIAGSTTLTSFPTNSAVTNLDQLGFPLGQRTGGPIYVGNQEWAGLTFQCDPIGSDTTNTVIIKLIRS